jgi:hypothetical protein
MFDLLSTQKKDFQSAQIFFQSNQAESLLALNEMKVAVN